MDNKIYFIIIIALTIIVLFYGGSNKQSQIEYNSNYFTSLYNISILNSKIKKLSENYKWDNDILDITDELQVCDNLLPNFVRTFFIRIKPHSFFDITDYIPDDDSNILIIFNYNKTNNLELLVRHKENTGYFYDLEKVISLTGIYPIYNNSDDIIEITLFIVKKPFWYK